MNAPTHLLGSVLACAAVPPLLAPAPGQRRLPLFVVWSSLSLHVPAVLAAPVLWHSPAELAAAALVTGPLGALLPDLDHPRARLTRAGGPVTGALAAGLRHIGGGHRGVTHHLCAWAIVAVLLCLCAALFPLHLALCWPLLLSLSVLTHLALDGLTIDGLPAPTSWPRRAGASPARSRGARLRLMPVRALRVRVGGRGERVVVAALLLAPVLLCALHPSLVPAAASLYGSAVVAIVTAGLTLLSHLTLLSGLSLHHAAAAASRASLPAASDAASPLYPVGGGGAW